MRDNIESRTNKGLFREYRRPPLGVEPFEFTPPDALYDRKILQPIWEKWSKENPNGSAYSFFIHLLKQVKP